MWRNKKMDVDISNNITERDILDFAIDIETKAAEFYLKTSETTRDPQARELLLELAEEERIHENKLRFLTVKLETEKPLAVELAPPATESLKKIRTRVTLSEESTVEDVLQHAIKREQGAMEVYNVFRGLLGGGAFAELLGYLAGEEHKHFMKFEKLLNSRQG